MKTVDVKRRECICGLCEERKQCFEFHVLDEEGEVVRCIKHCVDCVEYLLVRVVALLPAAILLPLVARGHLLIRM